MSAFFDIVMIILLIIFLIIILKLVLKKDKNTNNVNEWSYQRYAKFYGIKELNDTEFSNKVETILDLVLNKKITNLEEIAAKSNCTLDECILKIKYLKNKRLIGNYYIDVDNKEIKPCSNEDEQLLNKYTKYIYKSHSSIEEIARSLPASTLDRLEELKKQILDELDYLDKKGLINGVNIDLVDQKIIYYSVEKHKKEKDYVSINCNKCSALIDVPKLAKAKCEYCDNIVEDKSTLKS